MQVWRVVPRRPARTAFDGKGARLNGGRWNRPGTPVVYTSATLSLAVMEHFVNADRDDLPEPLVSIAADIPGSVSIEELHPSTLPKTWPRAPAPAALQALGSEWVRKGTSAVLAVPSAVVPEERNYLLNPAHPHFPRIAVGKPIRFHLDPRMWR